MRLKVGRGGAAAWVALALAAVLVTGPARAERAQRGNLIVSLDGGLSPLKLPRRHPAPVAVHLDGGLRTADGSLLPRVTRIEIGLPGRGVLSTRGLPTCPRRRLLKSTDEQALESCRPALVGRGDLTAEVRLPNQEPFAIHARLLAFNGRDHGRRAVIMHAFASDPPTAVVLPFVLRRAKGRFARVLVAELPRWLGPWPRFAHFSITLSRRYVYRGRRRSYLSSSCPIPPRFTAGFFSFARVTFGIAKTHGRIGISIARSCRAR